MTEGGKKPYSKPELVEIKGVAAKAIGSLHEENEELRTRAERAETIDTLTGLYNRGEFVRLAAMRLATVSRMDRHEDKEHLPPLQILFMDINGLKQLNDTYGHAAGNLAVVAVARHLKSVFTRAEDVIAHPHGDEFLVISDGESEKIRERLGLENGGHHGGGILRIGISGIHPDERPYDLSVSVGIVPCRQNQGESAEKTVERIIAEADEEMYGTKNAAAGK